MSTQGYIERHALRGLGWAAVGLGLAAVGALTFGASWLLGAAFLAGGVTVIATAAASEFRRAHTAEERIEERHAFGGGRAAAREQAPASPAPLLTAAQDAPGAEKQPGDGKTWVEKTAAPEAAQAAARGV